MTVRTDREMLWLAASACGFRIAEGPWCNPSYFDGEELVCEVHKWNPRDDSAQTFRLAAKLLLCVKHFPFLEEDGRVYPGFVEVWRVEDKDPSVVEYLEKESDRVDVTRLAVTSAAAEIGARL